MNYKRVHYQLPEMCHYYSAHHRVEGLLVSPTECLIPGTIVGRTKGRSLNCSPGGRDEARVGLSWVLNVFCKLGAFSVIQGKLKIFCEGEEEIFYTQRNECAGF